MAVVVVREDEHEVFSGAGRAALKAFVSAIVVLAPGVWVATNLNEAFALGVSALFASLAAAVTALQAWVPLLSVATWIPGFWGEVCDAFIQAFVGAFLTSIIGILNTPMIGDWKSVLLGVLVGAVNAGIRAAQHFVIDVPSGWAAKKKALRAR
jgi:hypothetical protein